MWRPSASAWLGSLLAGATLAACGPSFQLVYEGDARFEHCYALDETPTAPMADKTECWTQWMQSYTYGQTRNRVDYAAMRARALHDAVLPTDEALMGAAPGGGTSRSLTHDEPIPTNAFAPPPKTLQDADAGVEAADHAPNTTAVVTAVPAPPPPLQPPRGACTDRCQGQWQSCRAACTKGHCAECDASYGGCMKGCF